MQAFWSSDACVNRGDDVNGDFDASTQKAGERRGEKGGFLHFAPCMVGQGDRGAATFSSCSICTVLHLVISPQTVDRCWLMMT